MNIFYSRAIKIRWEDGECIWGWNSQSVTTTHFQVQCHRTTSQGGLWWCRCLCRGSSPELKGLHKLQLLNRRVFFKENVTFPRSPPNLWPKSQTIPETITLHCPIVLFPMPMIVHRLHFLHKLLHDIRGPGGQGWNTWLPTYNTFYGLELVGSTKKNIRCRKFLYFCNNQFPQRWKGP